MQSVSLGSIAILSVAAAWAALGLVSCTFELAHPREIAPEAKTVAVKREPVPPMDPDALERLRREAIAAQTERARVRELAKERAREDAKRLRFERRYPNHGVVYHYLAQVFERSDGTSRAIGYMRRGSQFRAKAGVDGRKCPGQWHQVPGDGYVCKGKGYLIANEPQTFDPSPVAPALGAALPYSYAYTARDDVPQFWEVPTFEQENEASRAIEELRTHRERIGQQAAARAEEQPESAATTPSDAGVANPPAPADIAAADAVEAPTPPGLIGETGSAQEDEAMPGLPSWLRMAMLRGFYVSVDQRVRTDAGRLFYRTVRGAYVRASDVVDNTPPASRGVVLGEQWTLPVAIVFRNGARQYERQTDSQRLTEAGRVERHRALVLVDDRLVVNDKRYVRGRDGTIVREPAVRIIRSRARPPSIAADAKWIHVRLSTQSLVAYEGDVPLFATLVSTGKEGFETPEGLFQIQSKHVSTTMDDDENPDGAYSIEDVPWTMYFDGNYALHGAFWHYTFGRVRSHGCVNLSPADARWLFQWSTPALPASWHGIFANPRSRPGTYVFVEQ